jgi:hypothetical protein
VVIVGAIIAAVGARMAWNGGVRSSQVALSQRGTPARLLPVGASFSEADVVARAAKGQVLWRYEVPEGIGPVHTYGGEQATHVADVDGDGELEVLAAVPVPASPGDASGIDAVTECRLLCLSAEGRLLWQRVFREELAFGRERFQGPWTGGLVSSIKVHGARRILWAVRHWNWWPSVLFVLDEGGAEVSRFVHAGHIEVVTPIDGGERALVLASGVSNAHEAGFVAVFDADGLAGTGPVPAGSRYECPGCPDGRPVRYLLFPPSEVTLAESVPYNRVFVARGLQTGYQFQTLEYSPKARGMMGLFRFDPAFKLLHAAWSDSYKPAHLALERAGKLDHAWESCPERTRAPAVRQWEPGKGWSNLVPSGN